MGGLRHPPSGRAPWLYEHARTEGAAITMPMDAFYGSAVTRPDDLDGRHWHFHESLQAIRAREQAAG